MRTSFQILQDCRKFLGMGDTAVKALITNDIKPGLLIDVQYLRKLGQINSIVFNNWLQSLDENINDYYPLTGERR